MGTGARDLFGTAVGPCRIKLCGMYRDEDVRQVNGTLPDLCGFIHGFPRSHRNVDLDTLRRLSAQVDERVSTVMVVVDMAPDVAVDAARQADIDVIQLHGHEDDDYLRSLRSRFAGPIVQAFRIRDAKDTERALASAADMVLLDAGQGSGRTFDWTLVERFAQRRPYILAGGLTPDNVAEAIRTLRPWGVDMSSGIETDGFKDPHKMAAAVAAVRSTL